jgi:hypothetical protein
VPLGISACFLPFLIALLVFASTSVVLVALLQGKIA